MIHTLSPWHEHECFMNYQLRITNVLFCCFLSAPVLRIKPVVCLSHNSLVCWSLSLSLCSSLSVSVCGESGSWVQCRVDGPFTAVASWMSALKVEELVNDCHLVAENHRKVRELKVLYPQTFFIITGKISS